MDQQIVVIGTIHLGITPKREIEEIIKGHNPDQILVEISQEDLDNNKINQYPPKWSLHITLQRRLTL